MPDITITDSIHATADIEFNDSCPLSFAKLSALHFKNLPVIEDFAKPVDQCSLKRVEFGPTFLAPSLLLSNETALAVQAGATGSLSILNADNKTLFKEDGICPQIQIEPGECWIGLELELDVQATASATVNGFGVGLEGSSKVGAGTYVLLKRAAHGLPPLRDALKTALENYSAVRTGAAIRAQPMGITYTLDTSGCIQLSGSYSLPISVNPLAAAGNPFNYTISLDPDITVRVGGEVKLTGEFIVRSHKTSETELVLGVYKKKDTTLSATFQARADVGETDVVAAFLDAVFPVVDPVAAGFTEEQGAAFKTALKDCIDSSLSVAVNASCAASATDESAIVYAIDLANGDLAQTEKALDSALHGDWTLLAFLPNVSVQRNVFREMHQRKHTMAVNLLGFYNAGAVTDYLKSCTILHDGAGQVALIDEAAAKHLAVAGMQYLASAEKLRAALAEGFIATVTYGASATEALSLKDFTVQQNYVNYKAHMQACELRAQLLLGHSLRLIPESVASSITDGAPFHHVKTWVNAHYDADATLLLFFADPATRTPYSKTELERVGRDAKIALLADAGPRVSALRDDAIWNAMTRNANVAAFKTLPELRNFSGTDLGAIEADWSDITWWVEAMQAVTLALSQVLQASGTSAIPNRKALEDALAKAAAQARSAFGDGWGLLTMFLLSGGAAKLEMNIGWNGRFQHYPAAAKVAAAAA